MNRTLPPAICAIVLFCADAKAQGPGGMSTNLRVWYKANANAYSNTAGTTLCTNNTTVAQWNDQTANALHLSQSTSGQRPTWLDGSASTYFNYNPSIKFTDHYLQRAAPGILVSGTNYDKLNLYAVYYDYDAANFDWLLFTNGANGFTRVSLSMNWSGGANMDCDVPSTSNRVSINTASYLPVNRMNIAAVKADNTGIFGGGEANKIQVFANGTYGTAKTTHTSITEGNYPTEVGDNELVATDALNSPFTGELGELFLYTGSVNQAQHERIESYIALKYSAVLNTHDYFSSTGTTIYDNSGAYVNGVIGIGRDDNSSWYQRQSRQADDSTRVFISTLSSTNAGNSGTFGGDRQFLVMGHNGGQLRSNASTNSEKPPGQGIYSRLNREWKITNTAFTGTFSLNFKLNTSPITATDLRLLVDDDGNFTNATVVGSGLSFSYSGGVVTVGGIGTSVIPTNSTKYFTLASMASATPLPVELLEFTAQPSDPDAVELLWATASEHDNDRFEIERSRGGVVFERIGVVYGAGTTMEEHAYAFTDRTPYDGTDYYRLKQVDADGGYTYSDVRAITIGSTRPISVYPNPAKDVVYIAGLRSDPDATVMIFNEAGEQVPFPRSELNGQALDVSTLPRGVYLARIGDQVARVVRE